MGGIASLILCCFLLSILRTSNTLDTISPRQPIRDGDTIVSTGQSFELGFFSPSGSNNRYLGIWYKNISTGTVVWVANREIPLLNRSGILTITDKGILVLQNSTNGVVWSSNVTRTVKNPVAQLLESGNLVVRDGSDSSNPGSLLWQSFDYPTDTFLAGMKLGVNFIMGLDTTISSWKSIDDPARGDYTFGIDPRGFPQLEVKKWGKLEFRLGSFNGIRFTGTPRHQPNPLYKYDFVLNEKEVYYHFELLSSVQSRFVVNGTGGAMRLIWKEETNSWDIYYQAGEDQCDKYATCGAYARCNINNSPMCECLDGFEPKYIKDWILLVWSGGCVRSAPLTCKGDGFVKHPGMKLPDTSNSWFNQSMSLQECQELCLKNCSCTAYTNSDIRQGGTGCVLWFTDLIDMREYPEKGQDLYIRMAASYLDSIKRKRKSRERRRIGIIISSIIFAAGVFVLGVILCRRKRKLRKLEKLKNILEEDYNHQSRKEDLELTIINLTTLVKATNNFSTNNKLGEGGFGPVYKGALLNGQEIAVKRLSMNSGQGLEEFKNEVLLIAKLQHRNLVKLLGCCIEGDERILIYEYLSNKSLDFFIFDQSKSRVLDWRRRINIIDGIARGLLYLHQDSRLRIIHRDLKASNVLLDNDMNPKISDFGIARKFGGNQTEANTNRVVGTYGYMAPEYAVDGLFSIKSDVFSFGVLVLEIVSGRRNRGFFSDDHHLNLLGHAWKLWMEERPLELIDNMLDESHFLSEIVRCIHVGLLCVQQRPEDRPNMSTVVLMLGSESLLPQPKQPGFFTERNMPDIVIESSSSCYKSGSTNEITVTMLDPR